jgi:hypothetical protein
VDEEIDQSSYIKFSSNKLNLKNKNVLIDGEVPGVTFNNATNENGYLYIKEGSIPKEQYLFHLTFTIDGIKSNEITIYIVGKYLAATLYGPD